MRNTAKKRTFPPNIDRIFWKVYTISTIKDRVHLDMRNRQIKDIFERNWNALEEIGWNSVLERKAVFVIEVIRDSSGYRSVWLRRRVLDLICLQRFLGFIRVQKADLRDLCIRSCGFSGEEPDLLEVRLFCFFSIRCSFVKEVWNKWKEYDILKWIILF